MFHAYHMNFSCIHLEGYSMYFMMMANVVENEPVYDIFFAGMTKPCWKCSVTEARVSLNVTLNTVQYVRVQYALSMITELKL